MNELTVEVDITYEELESILQKNNFKIKEIYDINDIYFVQKNKKIDITNALLLREIIIDNNKKCFLEHKIKKINNKKEIEKQNNVLCKIENIKEAKKFLESFDYIEKIKLHDHLIVYKNEKLEFAVQIVNDKHIYIELEEKGQNKKYKNLEEIKNEFLKLNINIKENNFFVSKLEIALKEGN